MLARQRPAPTVDGSWPCTAMPFEIINLAMQLFASHMESTNGVFTLTACVLNTNNMVGNNFVADRSALPTVKMPSYDDFK